MENQCKGVSSSWSLLWVPGLPTHQSPTSQGSLAEVSIILLSGCTCVDRARSKAS